MSAPPGRRPAPSGRAARASPVTTGDLSEEM